MDEVWAAEAKKALRQRMLSNCLLHALGFALVPEPRTLITIEGRRVPLPRSGTSRGATCAAAREAPVTFT